MTGGIDYSRFDKIELSDDSDIEVHPNIDKRSFIRWKQRDIHEKREIKKHEMKMLESEMKSKHALISSVDLIIRSLENPHHEMSTSLTIDQILSNGIIAKATNDKVYEEIVLELRKMIELSHGPYVRSAQAWLSLILKYREDLYASSIEIENDLGLKRAEALKKITSEDMHEGFDSSKIRTKPRSVEQNSSCHTKAKPSSIRKAKVENQNVSMEKRAASANISENSQLVTPSKFGKEFGQINAGDFKSCLEYISTHPYVLSEKETDGLLIDAFHAQMNSDEKQAYQCVHQALLLQYCQQLGNDGVSLFFKRIASPNHQGLKIFMNDVIQTYDRIRARAKALSSEDSFKMSTNPTEQIQLHALDPNTTLTITVPSKNSTEPEDLKALEIFESFSKTFQAALGSKELDKINEELGKMDVEHAEKVVKQLSLTKILNVDNVIYDTTNELA